MIHESMGYGWQNTDKRLVLYSTNMVNLCIDVCGEEKQYGRLYHMYTKEPASFTSLFQALDWMEQLYDELQFPQASTIFRSFLVESRDDKRSDSGKGGRQKTVRKEIREMEEFEKVIEHRGTQATFLIRVQHRQHSSWQGEVVWVDQQKKEYFRSALELVRLLDSALGADEKRDAE